ncbi:hypothetical protein NKDENANG_03875 [Candidatus Entotheonellaceae bacterium PAL068K]
MQALALLPPYLRPTLCRLQRAHSTPDLGGMAQDNPKKTLCKKTLCQSDFDILIFSMNLTEFSEIMDIYSLELEIFITQRFIYIQRKSLKNRSINLHRILD